MKTSKTHPITAALKTAAIANVASSQLPYRDTGPDADVIRYAEDPVSKVECRVDLQLVVERSTETCPHYRAIRTLYYIGATRLSRDAAEDYAEGVRQVVENSNLFFNLDK